jgi:hypothetical protein
VTLQLAIPVAAASVISIAGASIVRNTSMTSHSLANVLGWIVLVVVLVAAVFYGPLGQFGKPQQPTQAAQPAPTPTAPAVKGPVIKEVPN